jgi:mannosyltransferase OCH1-like enzyme
MATWRSGPNSDAFSYECFDDTSALAFIRRYYDDRTVAAFRACAIPAMRADLFRYCFLYIQGGVYADADTGSGENLHPLYANLERGLLFTRKSKGGSDLVANDFMIVKNRRDSLLANVLERAVANIEARQGSNVWAVTGPGLMTSLYHLGDAPAKEQFAGYTILRVQDLRRYVRFNWDLEYKKSDVHWTTAQKLKSIYSDM